MRQLTNKQKDSIRYYKNRYGDVAFRVFREYEGMCYYCGEQHDNLYDPGVHIEHAIPREQGGCDEIGNMVISCKSCNKVKNDKTPREFKKALNKLIPSGRIEEWPGDQILVSFEKSWKVWQEHGVSNSDEYKEVAKLQMAADRIRSYARDD